MVSGLGLGLVCAVLKPIPGITVAEVEIASAESNQSHFSSSMLPGGAAAQRV